MICGKGTRFAKSGKRTLEIVQYTGNETLLLSFHDAATVARLRETLYDLERDLAALEAEYAEQGDRL